MQKQIGFKIRIFGVGDTANGASPTSEVEAAVSDGMRRGWQLFSAAHVETQMGVAKILMIFVQYEDVPEVASVASAVEKRGPGRPKKVVEEVEPEPESQPA